MEGKKGERKGKNERLRESITFCPRCRDKVVGNAFRLRELLFDFLSVQKFYISLIMIKMINKN